MGSLWQELTTAMESVVYDRLTADSLPLPDQPLFISPLTQGRLLLLLFQRSSSGKVENVMNAVVYGVTLCLANCRGVAAEKNASRAGGEG